MNIFKTKKRKNEEERKMLGAFVPKQLSSSISLYCASKGINKSCIVQEAIQEWYHRNIRKKEDEIFNDIVHIIEHEWNIVRMRIEGIKRSDENYKLYFGGYLSEVQEDLVKIGITDEMIGKIIETVEDNEKNKK